MRFFNYPAMSTSGSQKLVTPGERDGDNQKSKTLFKKLQNRVGYAIRKLKTTEQISKNTAMPTYNNKIITPKLAKADLAKTVLRIDVESKSEAYKMAEEYMKNRYSELEDEMETIIESVNIDTDNVTSKDLDKDIAIQKAKKLINSVITKSLKDTKSNVESEGKSNERTDINSNKEGDEGGFSSETSKEREFDKADTEKSSNESSDEKNSEDKNMASELTNDVLHEIIKELTTNKTVTRRNKDDNKRIARRALNDIKNVVAGNFEKIIRDVAITRIPIGDTATTSSSADADVDSDTENSEKCDQTVTIDANIGTDGFSTEPSFSLFQRFKLKSVRHNLRSRKWLKFSEKLTYYLRIKYFMRPRDYHLLNQMINDARNYLIKASHTVDNESDYLVMACSVSAAFLVTEEEIACREQIKHIDGLDNMRKINELGKGSLGHLPHRGLCEYLTTKTSTFLNNRKRTAKFEDVPVIRA